MNRDIVKGSLSAVADANGQSIAETFLTADTIILVDSSGSMESNDARHGQERFTVACEELAALQGRLPGKLAVFSFSSHVQFCPTGAPTFLGDGTNLAEALEFVRPADGCVDYIVISDGQPSSPDRCLSLAKAFESKISTVYCGPDDDEISRAFLAKLAKAGRGQSVTADKADDLAAKVEILLLNRG